MTMKKEYTLL